MAGWRRSSGASGSTAREIRSVVDLIHILDSMRTHGLNPGEEYARDLYRHHKEIAPLAMKILGDVLGSERHSSNTVDPHPPDRLPGDDQPFLSLTRDISIQALSAAISRLPIRTSPSRSVACCTSRASAVSPDYALTGWILPLSTSPAAKACLDGMVGSYPRRG